MFGRKRKKRRQSKQPKSVFFGQMLVGVTLALFFIVLGAIVWYGTRLEALTIISVKVEGGETVGHESVRTVAEAELRGDYYRIIPRRFAWVYPEKDIVARVKELPRVKSASVSKEGDGAILVSFVEYQPFALWCNDGEESFVSEPCVFIDDEGYAFVSSPALLGTSFLRLKNGNVPRVGNRPFSAEFLRESTYLTSELSRRFDLVVGAVERLGFDEASFYLQGGGVLKTTMRQSTDETLSNLEVILSSDEFSHLAPGNFEYIDLRFGEKVFVNETGGLEDEELDAALASSTSTTTEQ